MSSDLVVGEELCLASFVTARIATTHGNLSTSGFGSRRRVVT
jgi:hypothetical protein